ncbi:hypothetical protein TNCV_2296421 [Trichonephila clavipes]|nr:hypothetical protein TNCV_2296421 [Trichonephila clavipes]
MVPRVVLVSSSSNGRKHSTCGINYHNHNELASGTHTGQCNPALGRPLKVGSVARQSRTLASQEAFSRPAFFLLVFQFLVLKTERSFSRPSIYLRFGLPFLRVPIGLSLKTFLMMHSSSILATWPAHLIRYTLMKLTMSDSLYTSMKFWRLNYKVNDMKFCGRNEIPDQWRRRAITVSMIWDPKLQRPQHMTSYASVYYVNDEQTRYGPSRSSILPSSFQNSNEAAGAMSRSWTRGLALMIHRVEEAVTR